MKFLLQIFVIARVLPQVKKKGLFEPIGKFQLFLKPLQLSRFLTKVKSIIVYSFLWVFKTLLQCRTNHILSKDQYAANFQAALFGPSGKTNFERPTHIHQWLGLLNFVLRPKVLRNIFLLHFLQTRCTV